MSSSKKNVASATNKKTDDKKTEQDAPAPAATATAAAPPENKAPQVAGVTTAFTEASEKYAAGVQALIVEIDKKLVTLCKSIDDGLKNINLTEGVEKLNKQIKDILEKLKKGVESIILELNIRNRFQEFYNQYYKDVGAAWNRFSGTEITPRDLGGILENIAAVQQVAAYLNNIFSTEKAK